jgi:tetratricopeptide (TPR) repeat protein
LLPPKAALQRALDLWPGNPVALAKLFELYAHWGKPATARKLAALGEGANPEDANLRYLLGLFWAGEGEVDRATKILTRAGAISPADLRIREALATLRRGR